MNPHRRLESELTAARADILAGRGSAADAAAAFVQHRLRQLERRFPRHRFVYVHTLRLPGLHVFPRVREVDTVTQLASVLRDRGARWPSVEGLLRVAMQIDELAAQISSEFRFMLGRVDTQSGQKGSKPITSDHYDATYAKLMGDEIDRYRWVHPTRAVRQAQRRVMAGG